MAQLPDKVLAWLYNVLHEYHDTQRTYSDAARTLSAYPSLSPRTEVYTNENGLSALLLTISGTLPVAFRGTTYRFPVKLWIPQSYPQEPPIAYVTPGRDMLVRPGQHVAVDGRVYHPYLRDWIRAWDRASINELLEYLQQAFAKEPPVISKAQQQQFQRPLGQQQQQATGPGAPPPQPPPKQLPGTQAPVEMSSSTTPPPRPPKPGEDRASPAPTRNVSKDGPPLPPLPGERPRSMQSVPSPPVGNNLPPRGQLGPFQHPQAYQNRHSSVEPPIPAQRQQHVPYPPAQFRAAQNRSPVSPLPPANGHSDPVETQYSQPATLPRPQQREYHGYHQPPQAAYTARQPTDQISQHQHQHQHQQQQQQYQYQYQARPPSGHHPTPQAFTPAQQRQPPPDLLSDPFDVSLPGPSSNPPLAAPPIPPNPEKEHLLHALSATMVQQAQRKVQQNLSALAPLQAQQHALRAAHARLEAEIAQLQRLDAALASNEAILHRSIQECDRTIDTARSKTQPPVDDVLVAPTLLAQQLWGLCADEAACREAMYALQKAVDAGRVGGGDFVRLMRGLGRECFLKMALARKCAAGLGLEVDW